jgi:hypothetical protein
MGEGVAWEMRGGFCKAILHGCRCGDRRSCFRGLGLGKFYSCVVMGCCSARVFVGVI